MSRIAAWVKDLIEFRSSVMTNFRRQQRRELREEMILIIAAVIVPLAALPGMLGLYIGM